MDFAEQKALLEREWFSDYVRVDWRREASGVIDGHMVLGGYMHRYDHLGTLAHEMAHFVEIDDHRAIMDGFGLLYKRTVRFPPTRYSSGIYADPRTCQGVKRECRVIAISRRILGAIGWIPEALEEDTASTIRALQHLQDWYHVPGRTDEARRAWCERVVAKTLPRWPIEAVRAEWWRKTVLVKQRLERQAKRRKTT